MNGAWTTPEWEAAAVALEKLKNEKNSKSSGSAVKSTSLTGASTTTATAAQSTMSYDAGLYAQYYAAYQHSYVPYGMYGYGPYSPYGPYGYMSFAGPAPQQLQPPPPPPPSTKNDSKVESSNESSQAQATSSTTVTVSSCTTSSSSTSAVEARKEATTGSASSAQTTWPNSSSADSASAGYSYPAGAWQASVGMASTSPGMWTQFQHSPCARPKSAGATGFQRAQTATSLGSGSWQQSAMSAGGKGIFAAGASRPPRPSASSTMPSLRWSNSPRVNQYAGTFRQAVPEHSSEPYSPFNPTESEEHEVQPSNNESFQGIAPAPDAGNFRFRMPNRGASRPMLWRQQSPRPLLSPDMQTPPRGSMQHSPNWRFGQYSGQQQALQPDQGNADARPTGMIRPRMKNAMPRPSVPWGANPNAQRMPYPVLSPSKLQQSRWDKDEAVPGTAASNKDTDGVPAGSGELNAASANEWPKSLKDFVHRCFGSVKNDRAKDVMETKLKEILTAAFNDGTALTRDWDHASIPDVLHNSPSFESLCSPSASERYGQPSSNLRSPRSFKFAGSPRGRRTAVGSSVRPGQGWSPPGFRRRSRSQSRSRKSRSRSSSRSSSSSHHSSRQRRRRHHRHRDRRYCDGGVLQLAMLMIVYNFTVYAVITGLPNGPAFFCSLSSVSLVSTRLASHVTRMGGRLPLGQAHGRFGGRHCTAGQYGYVLLGRQLVVIVSCYYY